MTSEFIILSGTANSALANAMAGQLDMPLGACRIERFPDGEVFIELCQPVRHKEVYLIQPTGPPVDRHLIELLALADACRRASAAQLTAVIPYFGYARADKRIHRREPVTARMVADLLQAVGVQHVVTLDLHTPQIEGFFYIPVDSLSAVTVLCNAVKKRLPEKFVVVSPDVGRVKMASEYANRLGVPVVILHKRRESGSKTTITKVVGDVGDMACLIVDDMIATGGTLADSIEALLVAGARPAMWIAATHGLFLDGARDKLTHPAVRELWVTDSVAPMELNWDELHVVSVAPLIASAIKRIQADGSFSDLC
jgi:ribose-phosphate pyrophosphokinase